MLAILRLRFLGPKHREHFGGVPVRRRVGIRTDAGCGDWVKRKQLTIFAVVCDVIWGKKIRAGSNRGPKRFEREKRSIDLGVDREEWDREDGFGSREGGSIRAADEAGG